MVWKGYYRDVLLFALKDLPCLVTADGDVQNLGRFHPHHIARYHALMSRPDSAQGTWGDFGIWTQPTFLNRESRRVVFDDSVANTLERQRPIPPRLRPARIATRTS